LLIQTVRTFNICRYICQRRHGREICETSDNSLFFQIAYFDYGHSIFIYLKNSGRTISVVTLEFIFESIQKIIIKVYDYNELFSQEDESKHVFRGEICFVLSSLISSSLRKCEFNLEGERGGSVLIYGEPQTNSRDVLCVTFSGHQLANKDGFFSSSDPFLVISRINEDGSWTQVWRNYKIDNNLNPCWAAARTAMASLCQGDKWRPQLYYFRECEVSLSLLNTSY